MKTLFTYIFAFSMSGFVFIACSDPFEIPLSNENIKPVVDGWIYDEGSPQVVFLSRTAEFGSNEFVPLIGIIAIITETSSDGVVNRVDTLTELSIPDLIEAVYVTDIIANGIPGYTYKIQFLYNGQSYEAVSQMPLKVPLDTLNYEFRAGNTFQSEGFFPYITFQDPAGIDNFYMFNVYRNDSLFFSADDIRIQSDRLFDGLYRRVRFGIRLKPGDKFKVDFMCIDRSTFTFLEALIDQASGAGTIFDTPPANVRGNVSNSGIGQFSAATIQSKEITVIE